MGRRLFIVCHLTRQQTLYSIQYYSDYNVSRMAAMEVQEPHYDLQSLNQSCQTASPTAALTAA